LIWIYLNFPSYRCVDEFSHDIYINSYQEGKIGTPLTGLTPPQMYACPKPKPGFSNVMCRGHSCAQCVKVGDDISFCWY